MHRLLEELRMLPPSTSGSPVDGAAAPLGRKAGGELRELDTWSLKLSQYDHTSHSFARKRSCDRWHVLRDGPCVVQRDMYAAFLAAVADGGAYTRAGRMLPGRLRNRC